VKTKAAVIRETGKSWEIEQLELDEPKHGEVLVKFAFSGMCHSDEHIRTGDAVGRLPMVGGHEGSGIVEAVGDSVTRVAVGDKVVCSFIPVCGTCRYCSTGRQNLCDQGLHMQTGFLPDGTMRFHDTDGTDIGGFCALGTFSERAVVSQASCVKLDDDIPLDVAALAGCGVPTGWGTAVYAAGVQPGQTVVILPMRSKVRPTPVPGSSSWSILSRSSGRTPWTSAPAMPLPRPPRRRRLSAN
jgi:Zn-dependent alcohol dehydrogenase